MRVTQEICLSDFQGWSGAEDTIQNLIEKDLVDEAEQLIMDLYNDKIDETDLNDFLRFETDKLYKWLGLDEDGELIEEEEDDDEEEI